MVSVYEAGLSDLPSVAASILRLAGPSRLFAFYGCMGAGKTTLIAHFAKALGCTDHIHSPTFGLVNEYLSGHGDPLYHFDFYRIENIEEAYDIGYETYFFSGDYCFLEWPERVEALLPDDTVKVRLNEIEDGEVKNRKNRKIIVEYLS